MSTFNKQDIAELVTMPIVNTTALTLFNVFVEKKPVTMSLVDGGILGVTTLGTDFITNLLINKVGDSFASDGVQNISEIVAKPLINGVAYKLLYDNQFKSRYANITEFRSDYMNYGIGAAGGLTSHWLKNPIVSFLTNMSFV